MVDLTRLALDALEDPDSREVLRDVVLETGWWSPHIRTTMRRRSKVNPARWRLIVEQNHCSWWRIVASVLLFGEWGQGWEGVNWPGPVLKFYAGEDIVLTINAREYWSIDW